ncbi:MAG: hypothetical protein WCB51_02545 [Candidatus Dormiibacterota bacterium]
MAVVRRFRLLIGIAAVIGVVAFAVHAAAKAPTPGQYISWAPPASSTATPGAGPVIPLASAPPAREAGPLGGLTSPLSGLFKQLNTNTAETATGESSILQSLEGALASRIGQFLNWVTGRR